MWFAANYAVNDFVALDIHSAFASSVVKGGVGPSGGQQSYSGLYDSNIAFDLPTRRRADQQPAQRRRTGRRHSAGAYDTGYINSLGDGGHGRDVAPHRQVRQRGRLLCRAPVRDSTEVNPQAVRGGMAAGSPSRFPGLEENAHLVGGHLLINATDVVGLNVFFGQVVKGNNTAASRISAAGVSFGSGGGSFEFQLGQGVVSEFRRRRGSTHQLPDSPGRRTRHQEPAREPGPSVSLLEDRPQGFVDMPPGGRAERGDATARGRGSGARRTPIDRCSRPATAR